MSGWAQNRTARWVIAPFVVFALIATNFAWARWGGGPENLILAVNQNSPASLAIANLYIQLRDVPATNVVYLDLPFASDQEQISLAEFRDLILKPIFEQIRARHLESQIDYIVYSADFPTSITINEMVDRLKELQPDLTADQLKLIRPVASINAVTYFGAAVLENNPTIVGLNANWYMRQPIADALGSPFEGDDDRSFRSAQVKIYTGEYDAALEYLGPLLESHPNQFAIHLERIRCQAGMGRTAETALALIDLARIGWSHRETIEQMPEFKKVADDSGVQAALKTIPGDPCPFVPTHAFRSRYRWAKNGGINGGQEQGRNFLLSTVLAVTRNNGISLSDALAAVERNATADASHPQGEFFFTHNGDVRTKTRQPGFEAAVRGLKELGYQASIIKDIAPKRRTNVLGALLGTKSVPWPSSMSRMVPGAIVDNLTSFGGRMKGDHHTPATEFLKWGAAGSSGTVVEPFAVQAKFAHPMIMVHYVRGCSLAEAYYQSVHGPFQLLIVGDALCQPWAEPVSFTVEGLQPGQTAAGVVQIVMSPEDESAVDHYEVFLDGVRSNAMPTIGRISFDASKIPDGYHELRVIAVARGPLEFQSRQVIPFIVDNKDDSPVEIGLESTTVTLADDIAVTVQRPAGRTLTILQNGRTIAEVEEGNSSVQIPASKLGIGKSKLVAVTTGQGERIQSEPVSVEVR